jgi:outer membrane protein insertion porin family
LCDAIGSRITSSLGYSLSYNTLDNQLRPTKGERLLLSQDFAGLGGETKYLRTRLNGSKYWGLGKSGFVFSTSLEGGYIHSFEKQRFDGLNPLDKVRLTDRFFLGEPQMRGFDIRGVGPRIIRRALDPASTATNIIPIKGKNGIIADDALGGRAYYLGRVELEIPLGNKGRELGLRPSVFVDVGALFGLKDPVTDPVLPGDPRAVRRCADPATGAATPATGTTPCAPGLTELPGVQLFTETFSGDSKKPRVSVGFGVNWNSPFGPFRIDIAKALTKAEGDQSKLFTFNVGTAF